MSRDQSPLSWRVLAGTIMRALTLEDRRHRSPDATLYAGLPLRPRPAHMLALPASGRRRPPLIAAGRGDVPLTQLRWRCARYQSDRVDMVVTSRDVPVPWQAAHP
jgi:hypothetical protein